MVVDEKVVVILFDLAFFLQCNLLATQEDQHNGRLMDLHEILVTMIVSLFGLSSLLFLKRFGMLSIDPIFEINLFHN